MSRVVRAIRHGLAAPFGVVAMALLGVAALVLCVSVGLGSLADQIARGGKR